MSETVYVTKRTRGTNIYHTDPDCQNCPECRELTLNQLHDGWEKCTYCAGEYSKGGGPSELYKQLAYGE